ncbi:glycerophosphoryl diester phosphodiesterase [Cupriavidus sp. YR651]|uniref:glycerophosphodiester phosphodiesterase family protein n=1 Tax=Cupriavidus sp. YR651 TaxID=1855315 RepID=UPI0008873201|nr:glycerophosphodiester phosphodiesterase family protein [Cupriavidus sp. YR651]SDC09805.1 glycerophosphoryl diester phosphodiesterase [Cupriavidus sp. YR651]
MRCCRFLPVSLPRIAFRALAVLLTAGVVAACPSVGSVSNPQRPWIVAHRAGTADAPENTLVAIQSALAHRVDMIWLSVQLSRDGVPVLYRPADLSALTDGTGPVAGKTLAELRQRNAGWQFAVTDADGGKGYPYRTAPVGLPTLDEALAAIPASVPVILDMKSLPAPPLAAAVAAVLAQHQAWQRVRIYSTEAVFQQAFAAWPRAQLFESRDATRGRLVDVALARECKSPPPDGTWAGFEMRRNVDVVERFTLGEGRSGTRAAMWTPASVSCFRADGSTRLLAIGVNDAAAYQEAARLGMDAVLVDSPREMAAIRAMPLSP